MTGTENNQPRLCLPTPDLTQSGRPLLHILTGHIGRIRAMAVTPDGRHAIFV